MSERQIIAVVCQTAFMARERFHQAKDRFLSVDWLLSSSLHQLKIETQGATWMFVSPDLQRLVGLKVDLLLADENVSYDLKSYGYLDRLKSRGTRVVGSHSNFESMLDYVAGKPCQ